MLTSIDTLRSAGGKVESLLTFVFRLYDQYVIARLETRTLDSDSRYYQLGWETRENPQIIKRGDLEHWLLPLYSDDLSISVVAYSDDSERTG
ncbi:Uncharacterised protein [BD1-7 clade bacterium]|uniref:Uncharacterized protein n=1 Tax=BD1-7 clade bacterium TaxID=2029982 RepID=A0A5S9PXR6_9GAMM|nr:Uncharacterised protein [BD1-7 clade bacterium]CAA0109893.1 Uncharacterised protein [BD1-7 clade bacterium]CAA0116649.1 Uncharacterised protein [BD1-7 clade bacterium]